MIAALVFSLALLMKHFAAQVVEDEICFLMVVGDSSRPMPSRPAASSPSCRIPKPPRRADISFISFAPAETVKDQLVRLGEIPVFRLPLALLR